MRIRAGLFTMSDEQAMWRVQMHNDTEAFAHLLTRWEQPIKRLCTRMLADPHKAEDLTQEAFARIYSRRKDFLHGGKFSTFLWRVAVNLCLDELRRLRRRREFTILPENEEGVPGRELSPVQSVLLEEEAEMVKRAVAQLPDHYRSVIILRHYEDLKFREIAEVLQIPEGTVKSRMFEALALLNSALTKKMEAPSRSSPRHRPVERKEALVL